MLTGRRVLTVEQMSVGFTTSERKVEAVRNLSFHIDAGETLAIVGESGSGKSVSSQAIMRLIDYGGGRITGARMDFQRRDGSNIDLATASQNTMRHIRGSEIAMIFQEPMTSLNPVFTVGEQIAESIRLHQGKSMAEARAEALRMLEIVRIPEARRLLDRHPHQLSGGMRQRVMIAMALSCKPSLLIADEPTTALDVTIQAQILQLIRTLQDEMQMAVIFITHDMGVVAEIADRVVVMCRGEKVEENNVHAIFEAPQHPYTQALLAAVPRLGAMHGTDQPERIAIAGAVITPEMAAAAKIIHSIPGSDPQQQPLLKVRKLTTRFDVKSGVFSRVKQRVHAVEQISFDLYPGETLALVGESGCGKSTTGRSLLRLVDITSGSVEFGGRDLAKLPRSELRSLRREIQFIFQDPFASLDPRLTVGYSIMEPLLVHGMAEGAQEKVAALLERVGLLPEHAQRYPHEFSGGQRQRICIARALALNPKIVIADESVSALDVSIQAQIVNLMLDLQRELGISFIFISHDMAVVERISHRVAVMYLGQIVEIGPRRAIFENPQHPYTKKLMAAVPVADPNQRHRQREVLAGEIPSPIRDVGDLPVVEPLKQVGPGHFVAMHRISSAY
ncbi:dipeptide ABC transporter ATP-binding protein [Collimonas pratensis]|uniref:dipeptide ABC transporter ATP-binding protein n=1 Tax=Collimonas pratensis TaxID=279113 RepID=UPI00143D03EA|nr:dipeptide ABC transporter ATP-binding protein [Collimonas pratensis]NKI71840.1 dipeptide ABC transporter ATP-binding protein [Collimonas pratensis]